ncbi:hypothetical protein JG687_00001545, partial [Phytophthora cactorum]
FCSGWEIVGGRFKVLRQFCGVLTTVFPNTVTVEADFFVIGWKKNDYRKSLTDFSFEGILHAKQLDAVPTLA